MSDADESLIWPTLPKRTRGSTILRSFFLKAAMSAGRAERRRIESSPRSVLRRQERRRAGGTVHLRRGSFADGAALAKVDGHVERAGAA